MARVIRSRYGDLLWSREGKRFVGRGRGRSGWWKNVTKGVEGSEGKWFWDNISINLGDGKKTSFWEGMWSGDRSLREAYPRMFQLCSNKEGKVAEMGAWDNGEWRWRLRWRGTLRESEKEGEASLLNFLQACGHVWSGSFGSGAMRWCLMDKSGISERSILRSNAGSGDGV